MPKVKKHKHKFKFASGATVPFQQHKDYKPGVANITVLYCECGDFKTRYAKYRIDE